MKTTTPDRDPIDRDRIRAARLAWIAQTLRKPATNLRPRLTGPFRRPRGDTGASAISTVMSLLGAALVVLAFLFVIGIINRAAPDLTGSVPGVISNGWATVTSWLNGLG